MVNQPARPEPHLHVTPPHFEEPPCHSEKHEDKFFGPDGREPYHRARAREHAARRLCQGCPFQTECALHGLEAEEFGVWGGLSERDRHSLGGVGYVKSGMPADRKTTIRRLGEAGFTVDQIGRLLDAWKRRRRNIERGAA